VRIEERKQIQTKDGLKVTSYELVLIPQYQDDFEMLARIGAPGNTFTGEVRYAGLVIRPQGSANHSERARDAAQPVETAEESAKNRMTSGQEDDNDSIRLNYADVVLPDRRGGMRKPPGHAGSLEG